MKLPLHIYSKVFLLSLILSVLFGGWLQAQTVRGTVTDAETGDPLPGVNILLEGTTTGTSTSVDGTYELSVPTNDGVLIVSFIGYETVRVDIDGRTEIDISLQISRR